MAFIALPRKTKSQVASYDHKVKKKKINGTASPNQQPFCSPEQMALFLVCLDLQHLNKLLQSTRR